MNTHTGGASITYPDYLQAYTQAKGSEKGALKYATFARHLQSGKVVKVGGNEFMSHETLRKQLNKTK